jgi:hypothetical protein
MCSVTVDLVALDMFRPDEAGGGGYVLCYCHPSPT